MTDFKWFWVASRRELTNLYEMTLPTPTDTKWHMSNHLSRNPLGLWQIALPGSHTSPTSWPSPSGHAFGNVDAACENSDGTTKTNWYENPPLVIHGQSWSYIYTYIYIYVAMSSCISFGAPILKPLPNVITNPASIKCHFLSFPSDWCSNLFTHIQIWIYFEKTTLA